MDAHTSLSDVVQKSTKNSSYLPTSPDYVKEHVYNILDEYMRERIQRATSISPRYEQMWTSLSRVILGGGKRMRPYLFVLGYEMFAGKSAGSEVLHASASIEMLHQATLVHDDVFDRDYVRHGIPNVAAEFRDDYTVTHDLSAADALHLAHSTAILAGDMAIGGSYDLARKSGLPAESVLKLENLLQDALFDVVGGELIDNETVGSDMTKTDTENIVRYKTASLSFVTPLIAGAELANATTESIALLCEFGNELGAAFQYTDDILGVFGDEAMTGKSSKSDLEEGKHTFMAQYAFEHADNDTRAQLIELFGKKNMSDDEASQLRVIFTSTGAKAACEERRDAHAAVAESVITQLGVPPDFHEALYAVSRKATRRDY